MNDKDFLLREKGLVIIFPSDEDLLGLNPRIVPAFYFNLRLHYFSDDLTRWFYEL
jgi:hypothetical protein